MGARSRLPISGLLAPWLVLASACADDTGTLCRYDYQCYSNSCTLGSCDDPLLAGILDALDDDDEPQQDLDQGAYAGGGSPPVSVPCLFPCEVLSETTCAQTEDCAVVRECAMPDRCMGDSSTFECLTLTCNASIDIERCEDPCEVKPQCVGRQSCSFP